MINLFYTLLYKVSDLKKTETSGDLLIKLDNLQSTSGVINVSLHQNDWNLAFRNEIFPFTCIADNTLVIENLPFGTYAIRVFHDENCNGIVDKTKLGYLKESVGFSGESLEPHLLPTTDQSKVQFKSHKESIGIKMRQPRGYRD